MVGNEMDRAVEKLRQDMVLRGETPPELAMSHPLTVADLSDRMRTIQTVIKQVMRKDVHYMVIPGTKKQTLTKEGSEILLATFHISVDPEVEDLSTADVVRYRVRCIGRHIPTGREIGFGLGGCSSNEEKYKWRAPVCREEFDATPEARRRWKWFKGYDKPASKQMQIRTNPEEVANTVLKMAKKRAQIDLTLTALAASDAFRDPPPVDKPKATPPPRTNPSTPTQNSSTEEPPGNTGSSPGQKDAERPVTVNQAGLLRKKIDQAGISENYFLAHFELGRFEELPFAKMDEALKFIQDNSP